MADIRGSGDTYGEKIDRCLYNSLVKFVSGFGVGLILSAAVFKRKLWPVILCGSLGAGIGVSNCRHEFKERPPLKMKINTQ